MSCKSKIKQAKSSILTTRKSNSRYNFNKNQPITFKVSRYQVDRVDTKPTKYMKCILGEAKSKRNLDLRMNQYSEGEMTSSIFKIIFTTCVARRICCCFPIKVSKTFCSRMSLVPTSLQSIPQFGLFSCIMKRNEI